MLARLAPASFLRAAATPRASALSVLRPRAGALASPLLRPSVALLSSSPPADGGGGKGGGGKGGGGKSGNNNNKNNSGGGSAWVNPLAAPKGYALSRYVTASTEVARDGGLDPVIGRDEEIRRSIQVL